MSFKGGIFDLDGVIVNTVPLHFKAWKKMFSEYGKEFTFEDYKNKVDGIPRFDGAKAILTDLSNEAVKKAASRKQRYYLELVDKEDIEIYYSTVKLINDLKKRGIKVAAASSSKNCRYILQKVKLIDLFDAVVGGGEFKKGKPAPEIFLLAASKLGLSNEEVVIFEDAMLGVEAAKNGGMLCIAIDRDNNPDILSRADIVVKDLDEIGFDDINRLFLSR